ncbi:MAG TPA: C4-dicarboxylate ABC transporter, partial [Novosphingobium sp.]|nr:C4-dicarboxylate ABC transporter [Novosphingobium sp.]
MAEDEAPDQQAAAEAPERAPARRRWPWFVLGLVLVSLAAVWLGRARLADELITSELAKRGVQATYEVEALGSEGQVLRNVVIGDPARPDATVERLMIGLDGQITLVRPRLYATWKDGRPSFGALDPLVYTGSEEPAALPDLALRLIDGRARLETPWGVAGIKAQGAGNLASGFAGVLAASLPDLAVAGCTGQGGSLYAKLSTAGGRARIAGPLRLAEVACAEGRATGAVLGLDLRFDRHFDGAEGRFDLASGSAAFGPARLAATRGKGQLTWRSGAVTLAYELSGNGIDTPQARLGALALAGTLRAADDLSRLDVEGGLAARNVAPGSDLDAALAGAQASADGTLAAPLLAQVRAALRREAPGSKLTGAYHVRGRGDGWTLSVPQAVLIGGGGAPLLTVSRLQAELAADGVPVVSGNVMTGGHGLPRITGRMEQSASGRLVARLAMADYAAPGALLAVPELVVSQTGSGALGFAGRARLSGALPGGLARNLVVPLDGNWSARGGLALWRSCTPVSFDALALANLVIERRSLAFCPGPAGAIVRTGPQGLSVAAGLSSLDLAGRLGDSPIRLASGPIGFAWPGTVAARSVTVALGPRETASRFTLANLTGRLGTMSSGRFDGADILLAAVPLDIRDASGDWRFAKGRLDLSGASLSLEDRELDDRFQPLSAEAASLSLASNVITAKATLREPKSGRAVAGVDIVHALATGRGHADLAIDGLTFDETIQPDTLSTLALGVIANTRGTVNGTARIDWTGDAVASTGRFSTESLDFAAAFGPVRGVSGTVVFTDLLGLVTAPDQRLKIASINPGIEARDGEMRFALLGGNRLAIDGA